MDFVVSILAVSPNSQRSTILILINNGTLYSTVPHTHIFET